MNVLRPNSLFCGYRIQRQIGKGGFAVVYLAEGDDGPVALKVLRRPLDGYDRATRVRFDREVRILSGLSSDHVVGLIDAGESEDGLLYAVFEFVDGEDLADYLRRSGQLPPEEVVRILRQCLHGLDGAHREGLVHRDIKPQNIRMMAGSGRVKLLDFGIARHSAPEDSVTKSGELIGTLRYMSPEQLRGGDPTPASDVYSLGVVGFELLLGRDAIHGSALHEQFDRLRTGHLFTPDGAVGGLWRLLERMTQSDPSKRYPTAAAVLASMEEPQARVVPNGVRREPMWAVAAVAGLVGLIVAVTLIGTSDRTAEVGRTAGERENPFAEPQSEHDHDAGVQAADLPGVVDDGVRPAKPAVRSPGCDRSPAAEAWPHTVGRSLPLDYAGKTPHPLIVLLHDDYVAPEVLLETAHVRKFVETERVAVIAPASLLPQEYAAVDRYRDAWRDRHRSREVIVGAVEHALQTLCIDERRVHVVAHGMGALGADAVKCEPWVHSMGVFGGALLRREELEPRRCDGLPPTIWLHPINSLLLPVQGGKACTRMAVEGVADTRKHLAELHSCADEPVWRHTSFGRCSISVCTPPLEFCEVEGGASFPGLDRNTAQQVHSVRCGSGRDTAADVLPVIWAYFQSPPLDAL